ncbi:hypothetical protein QA639_21205 [Bradyrhizobium pachyrhizi]|uniref:hypothetical protein n=1 Tax=Bradyrhizobium pachyrhizi TaxID=280333 RepID=UPI0024B163DC|nr:hypothetical protein [Bradyrhizobium pachyrhizi]WFU52228.1 hypothetical protein QA639_21205 [Bradyrhizobium pachyrhizi]
MSFYLVRLEPDGNGGMRDVPIPDFGPYDKGSEAAKFAKTLTEQRGYKVQPRRMAQAPDWRARQQERLASGALKALPAAWDLEPIKDHFAHLCPRDSSKIAFTEGDEHGTIDRTTSLNPGRYITRFYEAEGKIPDDHRRKLIAAIDPNGEIFYAFSPEEIVHVYKTGPGSCMDGKHTFEGMDPHWPTEPYGAGDLAVAYTKNADGRIQSRCLCWPEKKIFGRCYGDIQRMIAAMQAEGYTYVYGDSIRFPDGAKLLKIEHPERRWEYVMPYFDDIEMVILKGDYFETYKGTLADLPLGTKYIACGGSAGRSLLYQYCPKMRGGQPAHTFKFVHGVNQEWSQKAWETHTFTCSGSGNRYANEFRVMMATPGISWGHDYFAEHGEHCTITKKNHPKIEMVQKGDRRMHSSVEWRFDADGKELPAKQIREIEAEKMKAFYPERFTAKDLYPDGLTLRDLVEAKPWHRGMVTANSPGRSDFVGVDLARHGDRAVTVQHRIRGRNAEWMIVDDPAADRPDLSERQQQEMNRYMADLVDRQLQEQMMRPFVRTMPDLDSNR